MKPWALIVGSLLTAGTAVDSGEFLKDPQPPPPPPPPGAEDRWWHPFGSKSPPHHPHHHPFHDILADHHPHEFGDHHFPPPPPPPFRGTITVTGEGGVTAHPDSAVVSVSVSQVADRPLKAKDMLHDKLGRVQDSLGLGEDILTIKPERYRVNKNYKWKSDGTRELEGYEASQELQFSIWDLEYLDTLVDKLLEFDDLTDVHNIDLQVKDPLSALEKARELAVMDTQRKAEQILTAYGRALGPVLKIEESRDTFVSPVLERMAVSTKADAAGPTYQGKPVDFHYTLTTTFSIGRPVPQPQCGQGMMCNKTDETAATA